MSMIVGLTGGIATGKSTVSSYLKEQGLPVVDADVAARKVVEPGAIGLNRIAEVFGRKILQPDGSLDRQQLGAIIFQDEEKRLLLNRLLHPIIFQWMEDEVSKLKQAGHPVIILDVPLLYEANYQEQCDQVVVVYAPVEIQQERLMERNHLSEVDARNRISSQISIEEKKALADVVIDNSRSLAETYAQLDEWLTRLRNAEQARFDSNKK